MSVFFLESFCLGICGELGLKGISGLPGQSDGFPELPEMSLVCFWVLNWGLPSHPGSQWVAIIYSNFI